MSDKVPAFPVMENRENKVWLWKILCSQLGLLLAELPCSSAPNSTHDFLRLYFSNIVLDHSPDVYSHMGEASNSKSMNIKDLPYCP